MGNVDARVGTSLGEIVVSPCCVTRWDDKAGMTGCSIVHMLCACLTPWPCRCPLAWMDGYPTIESGYSRGVLIARCDNRAVFCVGRLLHAYACITSGQVRMHQSLRQYVCYRCLSGRDLYNCCTPAALREHGEALAYGRISFGSSCVVLNVDLSSSAAIMRVVLW